jgi:hypothetical protein
MRILENLWPLGTLYFQKNAYLWTQLNFMTTWNTIFKIMLTCGTKVDLWCYCGPYGVTKQACNRERSTTVAIDMTTKVFFVTKFEEISQEHHKSMTLKCGCVTSQQFSCSVRSYILWTWGWCVSFDPWMHLR